MDLFLTYRLNSALAGSCLALVACCTASAPDAPTNLAAAALQLETVTFKVGTTYTGLLQAKAKDEVEFVEICLKLGMPMSATVRILVPDQITQYVALPDNGRQILADHIHRLRHPLAIEVGNQERVSLVAAPEGSTHAWEYRGDWFVLTSTADEESTRHCIVRIEQIYRAFRQLICVRLGAHVLLGV